MDKGAGVAKQSRWYYDHEDGVCKVSEMLFYQESYNFKFLAVYLYKISFCSAMFKGPPHQIKFA